MIVEVTPRWRYIMNQRGVAWSTRSLRDRFLGRWVRVSGWMLFDREHHGESENTERPDGQETVGQWPGRFIQ